MKQITSLWNSRVGCLAFCLRFMCSLERDERTFTDGGPYFHRRRLWMWTNALQPCWALLWFSDTCRRPLFLYDTLHPFLLWEYEHTCGQGLVIDGYIWKLPQCFSIILHMGSRKLLISSVFFFPFSFFAPWVRSSFCVTPAPYTPRLTLTFKPSEGCSSWISWAWFNWELHWPTLCWCRNNPFHTFRQFVKNIYINIYIRGVTGRKIYGSVRYDTVVSRFDTFSIRGWAIGYVAMLEIFLFLNHEL